MPVELPKVKNVPKAPRVTIVVTQKEIDEALPRDSGHCMIADAVKATVPSAKNVSVDLQTIRWTDHTKGLRYTYLTPRVGQVALVKFDQGIPPVPFSFQLRKGQVTASQSPRLKAHRAKLKTTELQVDGDLNNVPRRVGGKPPPLAAHHGTRRAFGLRGLEL
jgi:hypothetical protein